MHSSKKATDLKGRVEFARKAEAVKQIEIGNPGEKNSATKLDEEAVTKQKAEEGDFTWEDVVNFSHIDAENLSHFISVGRCCRATQIQDLQRGQR